MATYWEEAAEIFLISGGVKGAAGQDALGSDVGVVALATNYL